MSGDNAQQHKCAQSINCRPAHEPAGKIKLDKACCVNGNSRKDNPDAAESVRQNFLRKNKAACTEQRREARGSCLSIPPSTKKEA